MLKEQRQLVTNLHKALDVFLTVGAFVAAYFIKRLFLPASFRGLAVAPNYYIVLLMVIIIWYLSFRTFNVYASYRTRNYPEILWNMFRAVTAGTVILFVAMYIFNIMDVSRILIGIFFLLNITFLAVSKAIVYNVLHRYRKRGFNFKNVVVVGSRERASRVIESIRQSPESGFRILGCLEIDPNQVGATVVNGIHVMATVDTLAEVLKEEAVDEVIFAMPLRKIPSVDKHITLANEFGVSVRIIPDWQTSSLLNQARKASIAFDDFLGVPTMLFTTTSQAHISLLCKRGFDITVAGIGLLLFLPLFFIIGCAIKIISPGPVFFIQDRCCLNGRRFNVYKFRTMVPDAEKRFDEVKNLNEADGPVFKIKKDPRIIPYVGTFLRRTSLDELPQLINILRGEMSLVGPRPPIPEEVEKYDIWQRRRLSMMPGMTCSWQCASKRNEIGFNEWMKMDLEYIDNWSFWLDLKIIFRTFKVVFKGEGR